MISKSIKKIWLFCLCLASLSLVGCFHVPDEDWLPSRNKVKTENMKKENAEVEQAINSLVDWFNMVSTQRNDMDENGITEENKNESDEINIKNFDENTVEVEGNITSDNESTNWKTEDMINE